MAVVEILCSRPVEELAAMEMEYQNISGHTLVSDLQAKYEDEQVCNILIERLSLKVFDLYHSLDSFGSLQELLQIPRIPSQSDLIYEIKSKTS